MMALLNTVINLISLSFSSRYLLSQSGLDTTGVTMPLRAIFILLLALIPLATFFAAFLLSISTFSRNMKEARSYEQPIMMVSMLLAMVSFIPSIEISNLLALIPVVNIALLFKAVMINEYQLSHLLLTIGSTLVLDVLAIWLTVKLFTTEAILFRTEEEGSLRNVRQERRNLFNSFYGLLYYALALVALYYLGTKWQSAGLIRGLVKTQVFIILLPPLVVLRIFRLKPAEVLRLKPPKLKEIALVPLIAVPGAIVVSFLTQLINTVFPFPPEYLEQLGRLFSLDVSLALSFLVVAVMPGICEEALFRGFMIRFYESSGKANAVIISALLFAVFHLDPFRLLPTFLLGLMLGYLTLRSGSLFNSMLYHAVNNGLALFVVTFAARPWLKVLIPDGEFFRIWVLAPAIIVFVLALRAFHRTTIPKEN
jgi:sodium transport system permease protein